MKKSFILIFLLISNVVSGQLVEEYDKFVSDANLTSWKEFVFSPGNFDNKKYLEYSALKNIESRTINEKLFDYNDGLESWTITIYNVDWKIIEEIELDIDSSIISRERITYLENGMMISECFDNHGKIDSTTQYTYFSDGTLRTFKFLFYEIDSSYYWHIGNYYLNENGKVNRKEVYTIYPSGKETLKKYDEYFYTNLKLDSIITFNAEEEIIAKKMITYENGKTRKVLYLKNGYNSQKEVYDFHTDYLITIVSGNETASDIRTIIIE